MIQMLCMLQMRTSQIIRVMMVVPPPGIKNIDNVDNEVNNDEYDNKEITERSVTTKPGRLKINLGCSS